MSLIRFGVDNVCDVAIVCLSDGVEGSIRVNKSHVPVSQVVPPYPGAQKHVNALIPSMHLAQL